MKYFQITILVCLTGFAFADVIVCEDFEGGVLPSGWQSWQEGDAGATEWKICAVGDYTYMPDPAHSGSHYAWHDDTGYSYSESWLVTDTYDLSTYNSVFLYFWRYLKYQTFYQYTGFYYSTAVSPGPGDFVEITELGNSVHDWWDHIYVNLSAECAGEANVTLAWIYHGNKSHAEAIDDFILGATVALEHDTWGAIKSAF